MNAAIGLAVAALGSLALAADAMPAAADPAHLNLGGYRLTFAERFTDLSVSPWGPGTRWIAHTPWNGDFGDARFVDPTPGFPFTVTDGVLRIEARKGADGHWQSGILASADPHGAGFSQRYGYFEMRAKLPPGPGVWPAFWLAGNSNHDEASAEVDVMEYYGAFPDGFHTVLHLWPRQPGGKPYQLDDIVKVPRDSLSESFHDYGVDIDAAWTTFYLDRREVFRAKTPHEFDQPMFILVDLALGSGWPIDRTSDPSYMYVEHILVYARR